MPRQSYDRSELRSHHGNLKNKIQSYFTSIQDIRGVFNTDPKKVITLP